MSTSHEVLTDSLAVIRDLFLEGRDLEAFKALCELKHPRAAQTINKIVGVNSDGTVAAAQTVSMVCQPQIPFKASRFAISSHISGLFIVNMIRVGINIEMISSDAVDGDFFSYEPTTEQVTNRVIGLPIDMRVCLPGMQMCVHATNISGRAAMFRGLFLGYSSEL